MEILTPTEFRILLLPLDEYSGTQGYGTRVLIAVAKAGRLLQSIKDFEPEFLIYDLNSPVEVDT
jgi:hypothetical protein